MQEETSSGLGTKKIELTHFFLANIKKGNVYIIVNKDKNKKDLNVIIQFKPFETVTCNR